MSIHHVLPETVPDDGLMETMCNRAVKVARHEDRIIGFTTMTGHTIQCVFDARDVNCKSCKHEWQKVKPR